MNEKLSAACSPDVQQIYNAYFDSLQIAGQQVQSRDMLEPESGKDGQVSGIKRTVTTSGIEIVRSDLYMVEDCQARLQTPAAMVELSFCMLGNGTVELEGRSTHELMENHCSFQLIRQAKAVFEYKRSTNYRSLAIGLPTSLFDYYAAGLSKSKTLNFMSLLGSSSFKMLRRPLDSYTTRLLHELTSCPYTHGMRQLYIESKTMELLYRYLEIFLLEQESHSGGTVPLSRSDQAKILEARELLIRRLDSPPSLLELARLVGLNEYKLKRGFKDIYGSSVYAYLRNRRMEKAWELLRTGEMNVSQAAVQVGYANFSHFSVAFRKQFGCNPSDLIVGRMVNKDS